MKVKEIYDRDFAQSLFSHDLSKERVKLVCTLEFLINVALWLFILRIFSTGATALLDQIFFSLIFIVCFAEKEIVLIGLEGGTLI